MFGKYFNGICSTGTHPNIRPEVTNIDTPADIARDVAAIGRIGAVPTLLKVLCEMTGLRFAAVTRVSGHRSTACALRDELHLGMKPGAEIELLAGASVEPPADVPIAMERMDTDLRYRAPHGPALCAVESLVSVPIIVGTRRYFGNLCAFDPDTLKVSRPEILSMFTQFAALIAAELDHQRVREEEQSALLDERAAGELREQFIAILGHDLRNPLQAVLAGGDLLERRLADPGLLTIASRIKTSARRMSFLIDDVLDFARVRLGGGIGLEMATVENINAGLKSVVQELKDAQPDCKILSSIRVKRAVRCDLGRLQQVASNLLGNALTHGSPNGRVKISARADEHDLILEVWNAGEPISPQNLPKIFEPFWRRSVSASRNGLGLGLHICSQILRAHGGTISVASTWEAGTRFTARLPLGEREGTEPPIAVAIESRGLKHELSDGRRMSGEERAPF